MLRGLLAPAITIAYYESGDSLLGKERIEFYFLSPDLYYERARYLT